jgi:hypothetical protein
MYVYAQYWDWEDNMYASPKIYTYGPAYSNGTDLVNGITSCAYTAFLYCCNNTYIVLRWRRPNLEVCFNSRTQRRWHVSVPQCVCAGSIGVPGCDVFTMLKCWIRLNVLNQVRFLLPPTPKFLIYTISNLIPRSNPGKGILQLPTDLYASRKHERNNKFLRRLHGGAGAHWKTLSGEASRCDTEWSPAMVESRGCGPGGRWQQQLTKTYTSSSCTPPIRKSCTAARFWWLLFCAALPHRPRGWRVPRCPWPAWLRRWVSPPWLSRQEHGAWAAGVDAPARPSSMGVLRSRRGSNAARLSKIERRRRWGTRCGSECLGYRGLNARSVQLVTSLGGVRFQPLDQCDVLKGDPGRLLRAIQ